jgi:hypothetical protein
VSQATCKGCGRPITWARSPAGADLPLEQVYSYRFEALGVDDPGRAPRVDRGPAVWISHFVTCKAREQFSGKNREKS